MLFLSFRCSLIDPVAEEFKNREEGISVVTSDAIIRCLSGDLVNAPALELRDVLMGLGHTKIQIPVRWAAILGQIILSVTSWHMMEYEWSMKYLKPWETSKFAKPTERLEKIATWAITYRSTCAALRLKPLKDFEIGAARSFGVRQANRKTVPIGSLAIR